MKDPKNWYTKCGEAIQAEFGQDTDLFIDLLAATSPRKQVTANWRLSFFIYHKWKTQLAPFIPKNDTWFDNIPGLMKSTYPNVKRALSNQPLSGNKVSAFAKALKGDPNAVVIDVWICRWYDFQGILTDKIYKQLADRIKEEAASFDMTPAEYQAMIWTVCRHKHGLADRSYLHTPDRGQKMFEFYFEEPNENNTINTKDKIIVEVRSGIAYCDDPRVEIVDYDWKDEEFSEK